MESYRENTTGKPRALPVVNLSGVAYFVDLALRQFRETMNPHNYVDFDTTKGREFCQQAGVVTCLRCGTSVIVSGFVWHREVRCVWCGNVIDEE